MLAPFGFLAYFASHMEWTLALRDLIASESFGTQAALVEALGVRGHDVNQATVSRALRRLGAQKVGGSYRVVRQVVAPVRAWSQTAGGCLLVLHTDAAFASILAQRIDRVRPAGVLGTIAGDDTVFVATTGPAALSGLLSFLQLTDEDA